jgi:DNA polymerase-3 subunit epsilon
VLLFRRSRPWDAVTYWSLDLEMGGLDPRRDSILAVGIVPIKGGTIRLGEGFRSLVRPAGDYRLDPDTVQAHQLVWDEVQAAPPLREVLPEIDRRISGGALLVHHQGIDLPFLKRAFKAMGVRWPEPRVIDTARLLRRIGRLTRPDVPDELQPLSLARARQAYGLPEYPEHDPLMDAVATAELFLMLRKALGAVTLRDVS